MNRAWLESEQASPTVVLDLKPLDGNYPTMLDCHSYLALASHYRPREATVGGLVILERRPQPASLRLVEVGRTAGVLGQPLLVPAAGRAVIWSVWKIRETQAGRALSAFYKTCPLYLTIVRGDRRVFVHRLHDQLAASGFILSPHIASTDAWQDFYSRLAAGQPPDAAAAVMALKVEQPDYGLLTSVPLYQPDFEVVFYRVELTGPSP